MLPPPIAATVRAIILDTGLAGVSSAIVSLVNTDIGRFLMVLAGMLEDALKERRKRQIAEATAEATAPLKEALKEAAKPNLPRKPKRPRRRPKRPRGPLPNLTGSGATGSNAESRPSATTNPLTNRRPGRRQWSFYKTDDSVAATVWAIILDI